MITLKLNLLIFAFMTSVIAWAAIPSSVQSAFSKIYPKATDIDWTQKGNYFVADFIMNGFEKDVWFDITGNWIMTQTDLGTVDELSPAIYNAFSFGQFSSWQVENVYSVNFPKCTTVIVIKVGQYNLDTKYLLFYSQQGNLQNTINVDCFDDTLWPQAFNCP